MDVRPDWEDRAWPAALLPQLGNLPVPRGYRFFAFVGAQPNAAGAVIRAPDVKLPYYHELIVVGFDVDTKKYQCFAAWDEQLDGFFSDAEIRCSPVTLPHGFHHRCGPRRWNFRSLPLYLDDTYGEEVALPAVDGGRAVVALGVGGSRWLPRNRWELIQPIFHVADRFSSLLDIGAGDGYVARMIHEQYQATVTAVDIKDDSKSSQLNSYSQQSWPITFYDGVQLPFQDKEFQASLFSFVLHHVGDETAQRNLIAEALRVSSHEVLIAEDTPSSGAQWLISSRHDPCTFKCGAFHPDMDWLQLFRDWHFPLKFTGRLAYDTVGHSRVHRHYYILDAEAWHASGSPLGEAGDWPREGDQRFSILEAWHLSPEAKRQESRISREGSYYWDDKSQRQVWQWNLVLDQLTDWNYK